MKWVRWENEDVLVLNSFRKYPKSKVWKNSISEFSGYIHHREMKINWGKEMRFAKIDIMKLKVPLQAI